MVELSKNNLVEIEWLFEANRTNIILALFGCKDNICGCDLVQKIGIAKNLVSYHIKFLEDKNLVSEASCGRRKNYRLTSKGVRFAKIIQEIKEKIIKKG